MEAFSEVTRPAQLADSSNCGKNTVGFVVVVLLIVTEKCVSFSSTSGPNYIVWGPREVFFSLFPADSFLIILQLQTAVTSLLFPRVPPPLPSPALKQPHRA